MSSLIRYLFFFVVFLIPSMAISASHAINPTCPSNGDGTAWSCAVTSGGVGAWNAIPASANLTRGDTYYLGDGAYTGGITFSKATSGTSLITIKKATANDYGGLSGWNSTYGDGQATFNNSIGFSTSYWTFDGVTGGGPGSWGSGYGIKVTDTDVNAQVIQTGGGATNITIKHVEVVGSGYESTNDGFGIDSGGTNFLASYIWIHDVGRCPIARPVSYGTAIFEYLYVSSYWARGTVHGEIISAMYPNGTPGDTTFRYSLFTDVESTGGIMWDNRGNTNAHLYIYGNVFYKDPNREWNYGNGVVAGWTTSTALFSNVHVYNNTFINIPGNVFGSYYASGAYNATNNEVYNNIFYNSSSPGYTNTFADSGKIWNVHNYNHYINSGGTHSEANGTSATSGDPFVDYIRYNFNLSTATTAGVSLSSPFNTDPNGITRGGDGVWDKGAYESIGGAYNPIGKYPVSPGDILIK